MSELVTHLAGQWKIDHSLCVHDPPHALPYVPPAVPFIERHSHSIEQSLENLRRNRIAPISIASMYSSISAQL